MFTKLKAEADNPPTNVEVAAAVDVIAPVILSAPVMVDDAALTSMPLLKPIRVEVELPQVVGVNGKICDRDELEILLLKSVQSVLER